MIIETIGIEKIKEMKDNPRKMSDFDYENLKESIKEFGCVVPLVVNKNNIVIGGNYRLKALKELDYKEVKIVRVDLPEEKARRLNILLNRVGGEFDFEMLDKFLKGVDNINLTGFTEQELKEIQSDFDYKGLSKELTDLQSEEMNTIIWNAKFKNQEEFDKIKKTLREVRIKNKLGGFKSEYCNGRVLDELCKEWEEDNSKVLKKLCENHEKRKNK